jgi:plastocyanin
MLSALAVVATACAGQAITAEPVEIDQDTFVTHVADFEGDVGRGLSLTADADGNPHMAYLAFEDQAEPGAAPAAGPTPTPAVAGAPVLPAVKHAHLVGGAWTRSVVADQQEGLTEDDATGIAVDGEGIHHVGWTLGGDLLYSNNSEQAFSEPQAVAENVFVASLAVTASGVPSAAFFGPGGLRVTSQAGEQTISADARLEPGSLSAAAAGDSLLVAYADGEGITLARQTGATWSTEAADPEGVFGVSLDTDAEGNPHLAYYTAFGTQGGEVRHAHSIDGAPWEVSTVAVVAGAPSEGATTSIAVAEDGTHHVTWQTAEGIGYANNEGGDFAEAEIPSSAGGTGARVATGPEGVLYVAWYDSKDTEVHLAVRGGGEPLLAVPQPGPGAQPTTAPTAQPTGPPPCQPSGTEITLTAPPGAVSSGFAEDCLAAPVGEPFTVAFDNQDSLPHNLGIYAAEGGERLFMPPETPNGGESVTYQVEAIPDPGQYYFQCDLHPNMNGTFVVA